MSNNTYVVKVLIMVLILDCNSEIDAHVFDDLIYLRHLIRPRAAKIRFRSSEKTYLRHGF